ncbi:hypothetical protein [Kitasatospora sp. MBT63]|uniref:hypothetical protein n=1 Tax=Kitasatospora sp. MBT63 TaxID=1444768 RepID=UPI000539C35E|nr:hypothetical protein [Kitasatospora sp. MBT63]
MASEPSPFPPPGATRWWNRFTTGFLKWWKRPLFIWFRRSTFWVFVFVALFYLATSWSLGWSLRSFNRAAQYLLGFANPFHPAPALGTAQQAMAITLRVFGWILVPATVGATAGVWAAEKLRRLFSGQNSQT